jgi:hypothetical protein
MLFKIIGTILLASVLSTWCVMERSGHGLVTTRPGTVPPQIAARVQGTTMVVQPGPTTVVHLKRIVPIAGVAVLGLFCFFVPDRDETSA